MINGRLHREMIYKGKQIIIDACEIESGWIEVMTMYKGGKEIESVKVKDIDEAERAWNEMRYKYENQEEAELKGKYKQLRDDLVKAVEAGKAADFGEDGGTCNFDAPAIIAPRWREDKVKQAAREAGTDAFKWDWFGQTKYVFGVPTNAQGNRRTRVAGAMNYALMNMGYETLLYCAMD